MKGPKIQSSTLSYKYFMTTFTALFLTSLLPVTFCAQTFHVPGQCPLKIPKELKTSEPAELNIKRPGLIAIGHRGSSFNIPEHTLAGYRLALELGADYIEPDLVPTKDGVLVAVHSIDLNITTDVATKFPGRSRRIEDRGDGFYVQDFTLEEVKSLSVRQRLEESSARSRYFDWMFEIPTYTEIMALVHEWNTEIKGNFFGESMDKIKGRAGIYVELKSSSLLKKDAGLDVVDLLLEELRVYPHSKHMFFGAQNDSNSTNFGCERIHHYQVPPLVIQSFDFKNLERLHDEMIADVDHFHRAVPPLVFLVTEEHCKSSGFWYNVGGMKIAGIGPHKGCLLDGEGKDFMATAGTHNLAVHPWTERMEKEYIVQPSSTSKNFTTAEEELRYLYCEIGIHGIFAENVDMAVRVGVRGCEDFKTAEELLQDEIKIAEEEGKNSTMTKRLCEEMEEGITPGLVVSTGIAGLIVGSIFSFYATSRYYRKQAHVSIAVPSNADLEML